MAREARVRWGAPAKIFGEKTGRGGMGQCGEAASRFGADGNLARCAVRQVARERRTKVARDPWGSGMAADASRLRRLENFRVFGGGNGGLLLPDFRVRNSFWR